MALIVAEAMHTTGRADVERLIDALAAALTGAKKVLVVERRSF
jgi:hypothetical protein